MALQGFTWVDALAKMPTWQRRHSLRACLPDQAGGASEGHRRHTVAAEALVPPDAARVAYSYRDSRRNSVHKCPKTAPRGHFDRSVYTPASPRLSTTAQQCTQTPQSGAERPFSAICVHYCVLASVHNSATAQQCTQTPQSGAERPDPPICVHCCDPKATHNPSPRRNSVHKCPKTAPRGRFYRFVHTPASVALAVRPTSPGW